MSTPSPSTLTSPIALTSPTSPPPPSARPTQPRGPSSFLKATPTNGSTLSLPGVQRQNTPAAARDPLFRARTQTGEPASALGRSSQQQQQQRHAAQQQSEGDRTDALWAEMQATLAEVEISAARGTHFFGPAHATALDQLRQSQVALAQAWARSEGADEIVEGEVKGSEDSSQRSPGQSVAEGVEGGGGRQEEAEKDILVARRRREANDRYFERVGRGVVDVVGRLDEVARAMGKVERESREIWSEGESLDDRSIGS